MVYEHSAEATSEQRVQPRGSHRLDRIYQDARVLAGFMNEQHLQRFLDGHCLGLESDPIEEIKTRAAHAREERDRLASLDLSDPMGRPIDHPHVLEMVRRPEFAEFFGARNATFAFVMPSKVIPLQVWVQPTGDPAPGDLDSLLEYALPSDWRVPAELTGGGLGPYAFTSSSPNLRGLRVERRDGSLFIGPGLHPNLVQVAIYAGRAYCYNGTHRLLKMALAEGQAPALVFQSSTPDELALGGSTFGVPYLAALQRPPVIGDFVGPAAISIGMRELRQCVVVDLEVRGLSVPS